ncbi:DUF2574 family protein [Pseudomonas sp. IT-P12]|jgi:hypothetical protein|uniref:hypothetical protein n=1 Tax=Pseudomonas TaxID=286 RepID=UPI001914B16B|nr:hypothetical protein [Pseudomonas fluorescens]
MRKIVSVVGLSLFTTHSVAATIKIENKTSLEIHEVYFAPSIDGDWGDDRLGDYILEPGNQLTLTDIAPGKWKLRLIDEDEDECILKDQKIVLSTSFDIRDDDFLKCKQMAQ